jgi:hypothetical protein
MIPQHRQRMTRSYTAAQTFFETRLILCVMGWDHGPEAHDVRNGRQSVPRINIQGAGTFFYGDQRWLGRSLVGGREVEWAAGVGLGGQTLFVVPSLDLTVVTKAGLYTSPVQGLPTIDVLNDYVLTAVHAN